ncbi:MAG TPA: FAD-binding protein [Flavitalea sp.]|nr:FAD-binding protein [Flavitalea sp.]
MIKKSPDNTSQVYDICITGGGLAGLSLAIQCNRAGYSTLLIEKEKYPFHRVCGEYISLESWNFLEELGVPLSDMQLPHITELLVTSPNGNAIRQTLPLGGFGISRYALDHQLSQIAMKEQVLLEEGTKVTDIEFRENLFVITTTKGIFRSKVAAGCFGKRSNLDLRWKRPFSKTKTNKLNNYLAVKYHVLISSRPHEIALHNFKNGYCGISEIEDGKNCLCYLTSGTNLALHGFDIRKMEEKVLMRNPFLKKIFSDATFLYDNPLTISQISFDRKSQVENHVLLIGDAAGMITPLCGNGMSMALHGSKIAFSEISSFLNGLIDRYELETQYAQQWESAFSQRLRTGRLLQSFFGSPLLTNMMVYALKPLPKVMSLLIRQTHGAPF